MCVCICTCSGRGRYNWAGEAVLVAERHVKVWQIWRRDADGCRQSTDATAAVSRSSTSLLTHCDRCGIYLPYRVAVPRFRLHTYGRRAFSVAGPMAWNSHTHTHTHTHIHPFNGPFSGTTWVSRYQKGKTNLDFTEARDSEWQWHQLGHMQVCTSLQTDNHASISSLRTAGTHSLILSGIQWAAQSVLGVYWKRTCSRVTSASSAFWFLTIMCYTNPRTHS